MASYGYGGNIPSIVVTHDITDNAPLPTATLSDGISDSQWLTPHYSSCVGQSCSGNGTFFIVEPTVTAEGGGSSALATAEPALTQQPSAGTGVAEESPGITIPSLVEEISGTTVLSVIEETTTATMFSVTEESLMSTLETVTIPIATDHHTHECPPSETGSTLSQSTAPTYSLEGVLATAESIGNTTQCTCVHTITNGDPGPTAPAADPTSTSDGSKSFIIGNTTKESTFLPISSGEGHRSRLSGPTFISCLLLSFASFQLS